MCYLLGLYSKIVFFSPLSLNSNALVLLSLEKTSVSSRSEILTTPEIGIDAEKSFQDKNCFTRAFEFNFKCSFKKTIFEIYLQR
jgi:hypothetical protein